MLTTNLPGFKEQVPQQDIVVEFDIVPVSKLHALMQRWKLLPLKRKYTIRPIRLCNVIKISKLLNEMNVGTLDEKDLLNRSYQAISEHSDAVGRIIAIALRDLPGDPPRRLIRRVLNNFTPSDLYVTLNIVVKQMNVQSFLISLMSVKSMEISHVSVTAEEINTNGSELSAN